MQYKDLLAKAEAEIKAERERIAIDKIKRILIAVDDPRCNTSKAQEELMYLADQEI